jgi:hypothetical protein
MEEKLWLLIDGRLPAQEKTVIEKLLETDAAWRAAYRELLEVNELLQSSELDSPSMRFTKNVMEEIARLHIAPATRTYINKRIIWGIGTFFIVMLLGILVYGFGQLASGGGEQTEISKSFGRFDLGKIFSNTWVNVFMMVNVVLGLVFLDQYLTSKKKSSRKEA